VILVYGAVAGSKGGYVSIRAAKKKTNSPIWEKPKAPAAKGK
jgi:ribosomal protein L3